MVNSNTIKDCGYILITPFRGLDSFIVSVIQPLQAGLSDDAPLGFCLTVAG